MEDAGFNDIDIIPIGVDKVFIHSLSGANISELVGKAKHFFDLLFSSLVSWDQTVLSFQRGAWVRLYGIPIHAWNENFFKLCVFDCGRFLRSHICSLNRERFDYARVLMSTSSFDVVNVTEHIIMDGVLVNIKIIKEWGFSLGEDACLFEEDVSSETVIPEIVENIDDIGNNADFCVDEIAKEFEE